MEASSSTFSSSRAAYGLKRLPTPQYQLECRPELATAPSSLPLRHPYPTRPQLFANRLVDASKHRPRRTAEGSNSKSLSNGQFLLDSSQNGIESSSSPPPPFLQTASTNSFVLTANFASEVPRRTPSSKVNFGCGSTASFATNRRPLVSEATSHLEVPIPTVIRPPTRL